VAETVHATSLQAVESYEHLTARVGVIAQTLTDVMSETASLEERFEEMLQDLMTLIDDGAGALTQECDTTVEALEALLDRLQGDVQGFAAAQRLAIEGAEAAAITDLTQLEADMVEAQERLRLAAETSVGLLDSLQDRLADASGRTVASWAAANEASLAAAASAEQVGQQLALAASESARATETDITALEEAASSEIVQPVTQTLEQLDRALSELEAQLFVSGMGGLRDELSSGVRLRKDWSRTLPPNCLTVDHAPNRNGAP
jgi:hypothetical protein